MNIGIFAPATLAALLVASAAAADDADRRWAVGAGYGDAGVHVAAEYRVSDRLTLRGAVTHLYFDDDVQLRNIGYSTQVETNLFVGEVQVHPWNNALFVSAGMMKGDRIVDVDARPSGPKKIGGQVFTPAQIGRIEGKADFGDLAPVLGFGLDSTFRGDSRIGLRLAAGVVVGDRPSVELRSVGGTFSNHPLFVNGLNEEALELEEDLEPLRYHPLVEAELTFRF